MNDFGDVITKLFSDTSAFAVAWEILDAESRNVAEAKNKVQMAESLLSAEETRALYEAQEQGMIDGRNEAARSLQREYILLNDSVVKGLRDQLIKARAEYETAKARLDAFERSVSVAKAFMYKGVKID